MPRSKTVKKHSSSNIQKSGGEGFCDSDGFFNEQQVKDLAYKLTKVRNERITSLNPEYTQCYNTLAQMITRWQGTESFGKIQATVTHYFPNNKSYQPYTVGAALSLCPAIGNVPSECNSNCQTSLFKPTTQCQDCMVTIEGDSVNFAHRSNSGRAYVFVTCETINTCCIEELKSCGIVKIKRCIVRGNDCYELDREFIDIDTLNVVVFGGWGSGWLWGGGLIILIIFIIIIILIIWLVVRGSKKSEPEPIQD